MAIPFSQFLAGFRGGVIDQELSEQTKQLVEACMRNGGKGSVSVTINCEPHGRENRELHISAKIGTKMPSNPDLSEPSIYYGQRGELLRDDPDQRKLDLDARREERELSQAARGLAGVG